MFFGSFKPQAKMISYILDCKVNVQRSRGVRCASDKIMTFNRNTKHCLFIESIPTDF